MSGRREPEANDRDQDLGVPVLRLILGRCRRACLYGLLSLILSGCATYHVLPISPAVVAASLQAPDMTRVRIAVGKLHHPLLPPLDFDDRDGLSPGESALMALITNPALRAIRDRHGVASAQLLQAGILPNPQLSYSLDVPLGTPIPDSTYGKVQGLGLGLDWDIRALFSRGARLDAAKAHAQSVDLQIAWQEWQVAQSARLHSYRIGLARQRLRLAQGAQKVLQNWQDAVKKGIALGIRTQRDLMNVASDLHVARLRSISARASLGAERLALNRALGVPPGQIVPLQRAFPVQMTDVSSATELFGAVESRRLDLVALKLGYESQEASLRASIRSQFPGIRIGLTALRDTDNVPTIGPELSIDLPIFDHNQGRIAMARASRKQLLDEYLARIFVARSNIFRLVAALHAVGRQLKSSAIFLTRQQRGLQQYGWAVRSGQLDRFSYYRAKIKLSEQQLRQVDLYQKQINLGIALEIASGRFGLVSEPQNEKKNGQTEPMQ